MIGGLGGSVWEDGGGTNGRQGMGSCLILLFFGLDTVG